MAERKLQQLISILGRQYDLTGQEIAEALWLADLTRQVAAEEDTGNAEVKSTVPPSVVDERTDERSEPPPPEDLPLPEPEAELVPEPAGPTPNVALPPNYKPFPVPDPPAIPQPLAIARALRPLARSVDVGRASAIDEAATVEAIANTGVWQPVLKPEQELWLDIALVFDNSDSMFLWRRFNKDCRRIFARYGEFRDVRVWRLASNSNGSISLTAPNGTPHQPSEFLIGTGRRAVVIISDCVAPAWHDGRMQAFILPWATKLPTAILQVFPERLWARTALAKSVIVELRNRRSVSVIAVPSPSNSLQPVARSYWDRNRLEGELRLPVVTMEPDSIAEWVGVLRGDRGARVAGIVWNRQEATAVTEPTATSSTPPSPDARVDGFLLSASPLARELAGLLASAPVITLPIVRLVQRSMLPRSSAVHVAEVFMSGLLSLGDAVKPNPENAEKITYRLADEVARARLRASLAAVDSLLVLERVSQYVARGLKVSIDEFRALLRTPADAKDKAAEDFLSAFARVTNKILRGLGSEFASMADRLGLPETPVTEEASDDFILDELEYEVAEFIDFPALEEFEFEPAKIVDILERFEFETAKISDEGRRTGRRWVIQRDRGSAWGYTEALAAEVGLAMVAISGGTFEMGSPKRESGRSNSEGPQHEVAIGDFYIGRYPVTQAQWRLVASWPQVDRELDPDPSRFKGDSRPVEYVSWDDATEFCRRLSARTGKTYRLPSEAEWEYACRAQTATPFHFGETIASELANYGESSYNGGPSGRSRRETTNVGSYPANAYGLHDMHGNVLEWCADCWHGNYDGAPTNGSAWLEDGNEDAYLLRGGSWNNYPAYCRSARRDDFTRDDRNDLIGFRVCCDAPRTPAALSP